jgi:branched-chain amino acid transport system ATP-binding protein
MSLLSVEGLDVRYGDSRILWELDLSVEGAEIVALIGANGAGKTSLLRTIAGLQAPFAGRIRLEGKDIARRKAEELVRAGVALVPEGRRLFAGLTTLENLRLGAYLRKDRSAVQRDLERVLAHFPALAPLRYRLAGTLSGGEQQMCAIGRALMSAPRLLLVDEMSLGLAPMIVERLAEVLIEINREDRIGMIIVEQDVELALELGTRGYVLDSGAITAEGPCDDLLARVDVRETYLGL